MQRVVMQSRALCLLCLLAPVVQAAEELSLDKWLARCRAAPANRQLRGRLPRASDLPLPEFDPVLAEAEAALEGFREGPLKGATHWVGKQPAAGFFAHDRTYYTRPRVEFQPFAQRQLLPAGAEVILHGDFHGDMHAFAATLDWLQQQGYLDGFRLRPNAYLVFLGDYVDRGAYGVEVFYTLLRLKRANPQQVFLVRGNHEDYNMTATYGFLREGTTKYGRKFQPQPLWRIYEYLPVVLYLGVGENYVQCNHGGMEPGYDARGLLGSTGETRFQLLGTINQQTFAREHPEWLENATRETKQMAAGRLEDFRPETPVRPQPIGFMWNDYAVFASEPVLAFDEGRMAFRHGPVSTKFLMQQVSTASAQLRAVFRAHQHSRVPNPIMNRLVAGGGVWRHWQAADSERLSNARLDLLRSLLEHGDRRAIPDGSVWTFNVSPDSVYGMGNRYTFDTIGIWETADRFEDWKLRVVNVEVPLP